MAGPVEKKLRDQLRRGEIVSVAAAKRAHGAVAGVILADLVRRQIVDRDGDRIVAKVRVVPEETISAVNARLRELPGQPPPDLVAAAQRRLQREVLRAQLAGARTMEERAAVVAESQKASDSAKERARLQAFADRVLADLPAIAAAQDDDFAAQFGIEFATGEA